MDRKYIQNEHIVDRYLAGELTVREARDFEKFCLENPAFLNELPIPVRLKARLARRPAETSETGMFPAIPSTAARTALEVNDEGFDVEEEEEKWQPTGTSRRGGRRGTVMVLAIALLAAIAGLGAYGMYAKSLSDKILQMQRAMKVTGMQAPGSKQTYRLQLVAQHPAQATLALGWMQPPQFMELVFDATQEPYGTYQITIDKADGTRIMQIKRIARDSNKEVRFALNSSAFGPGQYVLRFEGYTWRGDLQPVGWAQLGLE
ncbi:MAG TPA: hypothetical protein VKB34_01930 [Povalibacter sp.]|nr:hypothetical protein [Povalibacter sp.]